MHLLSAVPIAGGPPGAGAGGGRARTRPGAVPAGERGDVVLPYTAAIAMSLVLFVMMANVIVAMYGRGVVRAALDEGVRTGSRATNGEAECEQRAQETLGQLLGGPMGDGVRFDCAEQDGRVVALATVSFASWVPGIPPFTFDVGASAVKEQA